MPDTSQKAEVFKLHLRELEKIRKQPNEAEETAALIASLQSRLRALEMRRGINSVAQSLL
jgi:hypothetical protein